MLVCVAPAGDDGGVTHAVRLLVMDAALGSHREIVFPEAQRLFFGESDRREALRRVVHRSYADPFRGVERLLLAISPLLVIVGASGEDAQGRQGKGSDVFLQDVYDI